MYLFFFYLFIKGNKKIFFNDVQIRGLVYLFILSTLIMFLYLLFNNNGSLLIEKIRIASFNVVSILSGTGYVTNDFSLWGKFPLIFFQNQNGQQFKWSSIHLGSFC